MLTLMPSFHKKMHEKMERKRTQFKFLKCHIAVTLGQKILITLKHSPFSHSFFSTQSLCFHTSWNFFAPLKIFFMILFRGMVT